MDNFLGVNAFCIGSSKCGTTTLHDVLADHPDCCVSIPKETNFFLYDDLYNLGFEAYSRKYYRHYNGEPVSIDISPLYSSWKIDLVLQRISDYRQNAKIIYLIREPISKLESLWKMIYRYNIAYAIKTPSSIMALKGFEDWLNWCRVHDKSKIEEVMYGSKINSILRHFPLDALYVCSLEALESEMEAIITFLGLSRMSRESYVSRQANRARNKISSLAWLAPHVAAVLGRNKVSSIIQQSLRSRLFTREIRYNQPLLSVACRQRILYETANDYRACLYPLGDIVSSWEDPARQ